MMHILLDIDGVLLPAKPWVSMTLLKDGFYEFNSQSVDILNQILNYTNAKIILTTSHKHSFSLNEWIAIFNIRGIKVSNLDRLPINNDLLNRREEIEKWLINQKKKINYIIIDDDKSLNNLPKNIHPNLILTESLVGLAKKHLDQIKEIMTRIAEAE